MDNRRVDLGADVERLAERDRRNAYTATKIR
jgi:hypothetical protein